MDDNVATLGRAYLKASVKHFLPAPLMNCIQSMSGESVHET